MSTRTILPWRVRRFVSDHFPLVYHLASNLGKMGNSPEFWDAWLEQTWDEPRRMWPTKNKLIESLTEKPEKILDVGCGSGGILRYLKAQGYTNLHGFELSAYAVRRLSEAGILMHQGQLPEIPLPEGSFDVVIASQVLEHIIRRKKFLAEMRRVLRPGGRAFVFVPDDCLGPIDEENHVFKYSRESLEQFLRGFFDVTSIETIRDSNHEIPILFAQVLKRR